jgi:hypothetical protein
MNEINGTGVAVIPLMELSAAGTAYAGSWDTKGYDSANILIQGYNLSAASSGVVSSVVLSESDTVTSQSSMTDIVAFTGGTATSTSVGFVIGGDTSNTGQTGIIQLQVDLKKRKRYLGLYIVADQGATNYAGGVAIFGRPEQSKDTLALKQITNNHNTMASNVNLVVG